MSLNELLDKDRKTFEKAIQQPMAPKQYIELTSLLSKIILDYAHTQGKDDEVAVRINAFIEMALAHDVPPGVCCRVLAVVDSFTSLASERGNENYDALKKKCKEYRANPSAIRSASVAALSTPADVELDTAVRRQQLKERELNMQFLALRGTVDEYNDWLDSLKGRTRPLSRDDYTIRDNILKRMQEQATPHVIGELLGMLGK